MPATHDFDAHKSAIEAQLAHDLWVSTDTHAESYYSLPGEPGMARAMSLDHSDPAALVVRLDDEAHLEANDPEGDAPPTRRRYRVRVVLEPLD